MTWRESPAAMELLHNSSLFDFHISPVAWFVQTPYELELLDLYLKLFLLMGISK